MAGSDPSPARRRIVGVSTKMYFSASRTQSYTEAFLKLLSDSPERAALLERADVFIIPDHVTLAGVVSQVRSSGLPVLVGAQDCHTADAGAFTGEVSPAVLAEVGCSIIELGHAERRRLFGETDETAAAKAVAAVRNGMVPLVCVGEKTRGEDMAASAEEVLVQVRSVLEAVSDDADVILAYEPVWAIGASEPAPVEYVCDVAQRIRNSDMVRQRSGRTRIIYGGSAGPGLFAKLSEAVDGLFLGRFGHDPEQFYRTLSEVAGA